MSGFAALFGHPFPGGKGCTVLSVDILGGKFCHAHTNEGLHMRPFLRVWRPVYWGAGSLSGRHPRMMALPVIEKYRRKIGYIQSLPRTNFGTVKSFLEDPLC